jgi:hypothetical protein
MLREFIHVVCAVAYRVRSALSQRDARVRVRIRASTTFN